MHGCNCPCRPSLGLGKGAREGGLGGGGWDLLASKGGGVFGSRDLGNTCASGLSVPSA